MAEVFGLSAADLQTYRELVAWWRATNLNTRQRPTAPNQEPAISDVQIARTPPEGIPGSPTARNDLEYADCQLMATEQSGNKFRLVEMDGFTEQVFNLSSSPIDGDAYIIILQDRNGFWWANCNDCAGPDEYFTGTGTGTNAPIDPGGNLDGNLVLSLPETNCCGMANPVYLTITDGCDCFLGTHQLDYDFVNDWHKFNGTICGQPVTIRVICVVDGGGSDCTSLRMIIDCNGVVIYDRLALAGCVCSPLAIHFSYRGDCPANDCGCDSIGPMIITP